MLYARIAEESVDQPQRLVTDGTKSTFLGEAFSLTYVVYSVLSPFLASGHTVQGRLHFPLTGLSPTSPAVISRQEIFSRQLNYLRSQNILYMPPAARQHELLQAYFNYFHPAFPTVNQAQFLNSISSSEVSLLVLNAVLMIAVTVCEEETLHDLRIGDRYQARRVFYVQAKAIYDAEKEPDKVANVTGVFLISFWWGEPDDQKDSWHWLGVASSMAQSMGMHRT